MSTGTPLQILPLTARRERASLVRRARVLGWAGLAWHAVEAAVAIGAGAAAAPSR